MNWVCTVEGRRVNKVTIPVTRVTVDASLDSLSLQDYWDIYDELRPWVPFPDGPDKDGNLGKREPSIDKFRALIKTGYSKPLWEKFREWMESPDERQGACPLNRAMRSELRVAMGMEPLPLTVADAVAQASPDAAVYTVGLGVPDCLVMVGDVGEGVSLHINGDVKVIDSHALPPRSSQERTRRRKRVIRPCATETQDLRREAVEASWHEIIEAGLQVKEASR